MCDNDKNIVGESGVFPFLEKILNGWKTLISGLVLGVVFAFVSIIATPPRYEAVALLQGGQVALLQSEQVARDCTGYCFQLIESAAQVVERIRSTSFQTRLFQNPLGKGIILAQVVKSTSTEASPLIELKIRGNTSEHLKQIGEAVVAELVKVQDPMFRTWTVLLDDEIRLLEERIMRVESELINSSRQGYRGGKQASAGQMSILSASQVPHAVEVSMLRERLLAARIAHSITHTAHTIEPFSVSGPISSNPRLVLLVGALGGLIAGAFLIFAMDTWRRERLAWNRRVER